MPASYWAAEWVSPILQYFPGKYWVQTGFIERYYWVFFPWIYWRFYLEKYDENGHAFYEIPWPWPIVGHTYTYKLLYTSSYNKWWFEIWEGGTGLLNGFIDVVHHTPVDYQVLVETLTTYTQIGMSHFSKISYYNGLSWYYWDTHERYIYTSPPYYLDNNNLDYEFYAYGGYPL